MNLLNVDINNNQREEFLVFKSGQIDNYSVGNLIFVKNSLLSVN
jgi:hypothetical protein